MGTGLERDRPSLGPLLETGRISSFSPRCGDWSPSSPSGSDWPPSPSQRPPRLHPSVSRSAAHVFLLLLLSALAQLMAPPHTYSSQPGPRRLVYSVQSTLLPTLWPHGDLSKTQNGPPSLPSPTGSGSPVPFSSGWPSRPSQDGCSHVTTPCPSYLQSPAPSRPQLVAWTRGPCDGSAWASPLWLPIAPHWASRAAPRYPVGLTWHVAGTRSAPPTPRDAAAIGPQPWFPQGLTESGLCGSTTLSGRSEGLTLGERASFPLDLLLLGPCVP